MDVPSRRSFLATGATGVLATGTGVALASLAGCSASREANATDQAYRLDSLEVVNAHDEPHKVVVFVTAGGSARFARSVSLPAATHGSDGVDSANRWWELPVEGARAYAVHAKVDDREPRTHRYSAEGGGGDISCVNAVVWLDRHEGAVHFRDGPPCGEHESPD